MAPGTLTAGFRADLSVLPTTRIIRKWLVFGGCHVFPDQHTYYELVDKVAMKFDVHPTSVFVVGSAKLGFSVAPTKRYQAFFDKSDIDLVIVSDRLFDRIWEEFHAAKIRDYAWLKKPAFLKYLFQGWLRPDMFPDVKGSIASDWWEFFAQISRDQPARVSGALYRSWAFFEAYQGKCIRSCADAERSSHGGQ